MARRRGEDPEAEDEEEEEDEDPDWQVLQHLTPEQRVAINTLEGEAREGALAQLQIELFETQGIMFEQRPVQGQQQTDEPEGGDEENVPPPDADEEDIPLPDAEEQDIQETEGAGEGAIVTPDMQAELAALEATIPNDDEVMWNFGGPNQDEAPTDYDEVTQDDPMQSDLEPRHLQPSDPNAPTDNLFDAVSLDSNASYVGSNVHERLAHDFPDPFVNDRDGEVTPPALSTSPATASEHGDPATPTSQELGGGDETLVGVQERKRQPYDGVSGAFPAEASR
jgi:hypothetical protein